MSRMLASVADLQEALIVEQVGVDIIDLKQPAHGALGALEVGLVQKIVSTLSATCKISATVGDLPMQPERVYQAVEAMANTGVDYVKIGVFPEGDRYATLKKLVPLAQRFSLIAVLFADAEPDFSLLATLKTIGFTGVMLDTMDKKHGSLLQILPVTELSYFVTSAQSNQLLCGLAGSLRLTDLPSLLPLKADYLGFRGALCQQQQRTSLLDLTALTELKQAMFR
jgi:uncharacterized protein (UPF0264 family)